MEPQPNHGLTATRVLLRRAFVAATFVTAIATLQGVTSSEGSPYAAAKSALNGALQLFLWVALFPLMIRVVRLLDRRYGPSRARFLGHVPLALVVMGIHSLALATIQVTSGMTDYRGSALVLGAGVFAWRFSLNVLCYGGLMVLLVFSDARASLSQQKQLYRELQAQLNQARLDALRLQLQPHFLFNTLNGIAMLVREKDTRNAVDMLSRLAGVLRTLLDDSRRSLITVAEEIAFLQSYVELEQLRFHDRLRYTTEIAASAERALIPTLLLQPLYLVNADGTGERRLTNTPEAEAMPVWSGDGRTLLFRTGSPRNPDVRTIDVETGVITRLDVAQATPLAVNRAGTMVVTKGTFPSATLHVRPSRGPDTPISPTEGVAFWPAWSRSGTQVAFTYLLPNMTDQGKTRLWIAVVNADGTGFRKITPDSLRAEAPAWFPDGKRIAFQASINGNYDIWVANVDGSGAHRLTTSPHLDEVPSISPDGKTIVFQSDRDGPVDLWLMDVDGRNIRKLIR